MLTSTESKATGTSEGHRSLYNFVFLLWHLFYITLLAPRNWRLPVGFWEICGILAFIVFHLIVTDFHDNGNIPCEFKGRNAQAVGNVTEKFEAHFSVLISCVC
jgi:hypothetical protein